MIILVARSSFRFLFACSALGGSFLIAGCEGARAGEPEDSAIVMPLIAKDLVGVPDKEAVMLTVEYPPGASSQAHRHDANVFVYVLHGTLLMQVDGVRHVRETPSFAKIYGKRIVVIGGGAQVGLVATGAISEADRHNIRGERISIDTIPLVGEQDLAAAVRAVVRLPRVRILVLAGSIMGGDITEAVKEVQASGMRVISLNMVGSVPDVADLVVTDPVQAGVMAVMAIADTARFDIARQLKRRY